MPKATSTKDSAVPPSLQITPSPDPKLATSGIKNHPSFPVKTPDMIPEKGHKVSVKFNYAPLKKPQTKWGNWVDIHETLVDCIMVAWFTRFDKVEAPYIRSVVDAFENDTSAEDFQNEWNIIGFFSRVLEHKNKCMPKSIGSPFNWEAVVIVKKNADDTVESLGRNLATKMTQFAKATAQNPNPPPFVFRKAHVANPHPLNSYLLDEDATAILKRMYSDSNKSDLLEKDEVLESFFGSRAYGETVLTEMSNDEWDNMA
jgi:hypothetical protein